MAGDGSGSTGKPVGPATQGQGDRGLRPPTAQPQQQANRGGRRLNEVLNIPPAIALRMNPETLNYAAYLGMRFKVQYQNNELWRPHKGDSGIHATGTAIDIPVDPNTAQGRQIIADAKSRGFYAYYEPHGSGPHIHIETHRNRR